MAAGLDPFFTARRQVLLAGGAAAAAAGHPSRAVLGNGSPVVASASFGEAKRVVHIYLHGGAPTRSVLFAGAGIRGGTLCGASDALAAYGKDRPTRPAEIGATIVHLLGIDPEMTVQDRIRGPIAVSRSGTAIGDILG